MTINKFGSVNARPVKSFFVDMLTRDIELVDAILDLLDNCVDGILRQKGKESGETPYKGFWAEIQFDENSFSISDNCGGIPWNLHEYAFRMGKEDRDRDSNLPTIGVYGIGMKRAIFKIGQECSILTQNKDDCYEVKITSDWIQKPNDWELPVSGSSERKKEDGTTIVISKLNGGITTHFGENSKNFDSQLTKKVKTHYAFILEKGFQVKINGNVVEAKTTRLIFDDTGSGDSVIKPYIFKAKDDGVDIFLCVGFKESIPSQEEVSEEQRKRRFSSAEAGWTIICNDRAVLYHDRTELTGWGDTRVPRYHTQFIAIAGIVEFKSDNAANLPTTTTKRGINASLPLYLQVRRRMIEGMRMFTNYTNKWKERSNESKLYTEGKPRCTLYEIKEKFQGLEPTNLHGGIGGSHFKPPLPLPKPQLSSDRRITYNKSVDDIETVRSYLFREEEAQPSQVGEKCFDVMLKEARQ